MSSWFENSFIKNVLTIAAGNTFAQAITVLIAPILTRIYLPADYGNYVLFTSVVSLICVFSAGSYERAIMLPEDSKSANSLFGLSLLAHSGTTMIILIVLFAVWKMDTQVIQENQWLWIVPAGVFILGLVRIFGYFLSRIQKFKEITTMQMIQSILSSGIQITAGLLYSLGSLGLIIGNVIGSLVAVVGVSCHANKIMDWKNRVSDFRLKAQLDVAKRYKKFPKYNIFSDILNSSSSMLPLLLLGYYYNPVIVGWFALGQRVLALPMGLIGNSIAQVYFPKAVGERREGIAGKGMLRLFKTLLSLSLVPMVLLMIIGPELFSFVFGSKWVTAGTYVSYLGPWMLMVFVVSPLAVLFDVYERQRELLFFNILLFTTRLFVLVVGGKTGSALETVLVLGLTGVVLYLG
ncbi:MAG: lipopolysaccharide biosynthesis protein, partial [Chitinophagales bacterium]